MNKSTLAYTADDVPFDPEPRRSFTIPARFYRDPEIYRLEKEAIFFRNWWLAGHVSRLPEAGSYLTTQIDEQNILIVRGRDGALRAFYNVCQHRGHELTRETAGKFSNLMVCPYHAWSFNLEGDLVRARNSEQVDGFDKCSFSLKPVRVEEFCGLIFVNLDPAAESLSAMTENLEDEMRHYMPRLDQLVYSCRYEYDVACNWKVMMDNFLECYHCHPAHPALVDLMDMDSYTTRTHKYYSSHIAGAPRATHNAAYDFEVGDVDFGYAAWYLWPNLTIWMYPGEPNIMTLQMIPDGPERTREILDVYLLEPTPSQQCQAALDYMDSVLQPEDIGLCESVQRGLRSKGYNQGRFIIDKDLSSLSEHGVHHFQSLVMQSLGMQAPDA